MRILLACEESQACCIAFRAAGHEAYSCDILPCSGGHPEWHIQNDISQVLNPGIQLAGLSGEYYGIKPFVTMDGEYHFITGKWDMILGFPPCTYLSNAGARHLYKGGQLNMDRYVKGVEAKEFFLTILNADCSRIAIENPTPSRVYGLPQYSQTIQPYQFGHPFTKRTHLWLKGLPPLNPTDIVVPERTWCPSGSYSHKHGEKHRGMFTRDRARNRSKTFQGIALAMAEQWGAL